jgi:hypothetical protein
MTCQRDDTQELGITKVQGAPNEPDHGAEPDRWRRFKEFILPWLKKGSDLGAEYSEARLAQEKNKARKTAEEAAEIAARRDVAQQRAVRDFGANVDAIFADDGLPDEARALKFAKLIESNPHLLDQFEKVKALLTSLHLDKGLSIDPLEEQVGAPSKALPGGAADQA